MNNSQHCYTVEFGLPLVNVVYYRNILASDPDDASARIRAGYPDAIIRAVSLLDVEPQLIETPK